jgi:hypothetical protein
LNTCKDCLEDYEIEDLNDFMVCYRCDHECNLACGMPCEIKREKLMKETEIWDNFAEATESLADIYPEIKETSVWVMLVDLGLILEEKGN